MTSAALPDAARPSRLRWVFERSVFPVVMVGSMWALFALMDAGVAAPLAAAGLQILVFALVMALERVIPFHESWKHGHGDMRVDAAHAVTTLVAGRLAQPLLIGGGIAAAGWLSAHLGLGLWPHAWPLVAQVVFAVVLVEAFHYWVHRLQHTTELLWRIHATHHAVDRLYWLNSTRFHFLDTLSLAVTGFLPMIALGAPVEMIALWTLFSAVHGVFQHANLPLRLGPLNWIFSMAELHRWHHSPVTAEANHNYGQNIILWDIVFGTRWLPKDREPPERPGIEDLPAFPMTWWQQILSPFRWQRIKAASEAVQAERAATRA